MKKSNGVLLAVVYLFAASSLSGQQSASAKSTNPSRNSTPVVDSTGPAAASSAQPTSQTVIPRSIRFSGALQDLAGKPITGPVDVTFSLYAEQSGGSPLWFETQTVQADSLGHYTVLLGAMTPVGVPMELFTGGEARWLGVQVSNLPEQPRVLLVSVPYAMKAGDAETLGGRPASEYQLSPQAETSSRITRRSGKTTTRESATSSSAASKSQRITAQTIVATPNFIPVFTNSDGSMSNSVMYQSSGRIGIGTTTPFYGLDINANVIGVGTTVPKPGYAGSLRFRDDTGTPRWLFGMLGTSGATTFNVSDMINHYQPFIVQAGAPTNSLVLTPTGVGIGTTTPAAKLDVVGNITTSGNLKLPITPVGGSTGVMYRGSLPFIHGCCDLNSSNYSGNVFVGLYAGNFGMATTVIGNTGVGNYALNADTTGGNNTAIGSSTLQHNTTGASNTAVGYFALEQNTIGLTNTAVGAFSLYSNAGGFDNTAMGDAALQNNTTGAGNTAVGVVALNANSSGSYNTASGENALRENTTGTTNTAMGVEALYSNTGGNGNAAFGSQALYENIDAIYNTAIGYQALYFNCSGVASSCGASGNTAIGYQAGVTNTSVNTNKTGANNTFIGFESGPSTASQLNNATAIGANAAVGESNALVLGSINGVNGATSNVNVGIGTTTPISPLQVATGDIVVGPTTSLPYSNTNGVYVTNDLGDAYNTFRLDAYKDDLAIAGFSAASASKGTTITFRTSTPGAGEANRVRISSSGEVGIGTMAPAYALDVVGDIRTSGCVIYNGGSVGSCASPSDARLKMNIQSFGPVLDRLVALRPVHFEWNPTNPPKYRFAPGRNPGLIAQEVERVFPDMVTTGDDGYKRVYYNELPYLLLQGIRELKASNDRQQTEIMDLSRAASEKDEQIATLTRQLKQMRESQARLNMLKARLARLEESAALGSGNSSSRAGIRGVNGRSRQAAKKGRRNSYQIARVRF
jgi:Chaperone of endosialidase